MGVAVSDVRTVYMLVLTQDYLGSKAPDLNCMLDGENMVYLARQCGISNVTWMHNATLEEAKSEIKRHAGLCQGEDTFFLYFAGHGCHVKGVDETEQDGLDESWVFAPDGYGQGSSQPKWGIDSSKYGYLVDDELAMIISSACHRDATVWILSDACNSATIGDLHKSCWKGIKAVTLSACHDFEQATEVDGKGGLFTGVLLETLEALCASGPPCPLTANELFRNMKLSRAYQKFKGEQQFQLIATADANCERLQFPLVPKKGFNVNVFNDEKGLEIEIGGTRKRILLPLAYWGLKMWENRDEQNVFEAAAKDAVGDANKVKEATTSNFRILNDSPRPIWMKATAHKETVTAVGFVAGIVSAACTGGSSLVAAAAASAAAMVAVGAATANITESVRNGLKDRGMTMVAPGEHFEARFTLCTPLTVELVTDVPKQEALHMIALEVGYEVVGLLGAGAQLKDAMALSKEAAKNVTKKALQIGAEEVGARIKKELKDNAMDHMKEFAAGALDAYMAEDSCTAWTAKSSNGARDYKLSELSPKMFTSSVETSEMETIFHLVHMASAAA